jgi:VanZ family protein
MSRRDFWAWAWTALIVVVSWIPEHVMGLKEEENKTIQTFQLDKVAHVALFFGFAWLWMDAAWSRRRVARVLGTGLLLAVVTEIGQESALVGRDANLLDLLADLLGLILGVAAYRLLVPRNERLRVVSSRGLTAVGRSAHHP